MVVPLPPVRPIKGIISLIHDDLRELQQNKGEQLFDHGNMYVTGVGSIID